MFRDIDSAMRRYFELGVLLQGRFDYSPVRTYFTQRVVNSYNSTPYYGVASAGISTPNTTLYTGATTGVFSLNFYYPGLDWGSLVGNVSFYCGGGGGGDWFLGTYPIDLSTSGTGGGYGFYSLPVGLSIPADANGKIANITMKITLANGKTIDIPAYGLGIEFITDIGIEYIDELPVPERYFATFADGVAVQDSVSFMFKGLSTPYLSTLEGLVVSDSLSLKFIAEPTPYLGFPDSVGISDSVSIKSIAEPTPYQEYTDSVGVSDVTIIRGIPIPNPYLDGTDSVSVSDSTTIKGVPIPNPYKDIYEGTVMSDSITFEFIPPVTPYKDTLQEMTVSDVYSFRYVELPTYNPHFDEETSVAGVCTFRFNAVPTPYSHVLESVASSDSFSLLSK